MIAEFAIVRLKEINDRLLYTDDLVEEDMQFLYKCLHHENQKVVHGSIILITELKKDYILPVIHNFSSFSLQQKKTILPILMVCNFMEPYKFLLDYLKTVKDDEFALFIVICLSNTDYFIFPLILVRLDTDNLIYKGRLKEILRRIGYSSLEKYLVLLPELVYENDFRDVFGQEKINQLKLVISQKNNP